MEKIAITLRTLHLVNEGCHAEGSPQKKRGFIFVPKCGYKFDQSIANRHQGRSAPGSQ